MLKSTLAIFSFFLFSSEAMAVNDTPRTITVTGNAQVKVVPDEVVIYFTVDTRGGDLNTAKAKNDEIIKKVVAYAADNLKVERKNIQTDYTNIQPNYNSCSNEDITQRGCDPLKVVFYRVAKGVQIKLFDLTKYDDLITHALQAGVTNIDEVQFQTTDLRKQRDKAREMAAIAAREKADAIAKTLGAKVTRVVTINEQANNYYSSTINSIRGTYGNAQNIAVNGGGGGAASEGSELAPGQINISADINVVFDIE